MTELAPVAVPLLLVAVLFDSQRHVCLLNLYFLLGLFGLSGLLDHHLVQFHLLDITGFKFFLDPSFVVFLNGIVVSISVVHFVLRGVVDVGFLAVMNNFDWAACVILDGGHSRLDGWSTAFVVVKTPLCFFLFGVTLMRVANKHLFMSYVLVWSQDSLPLHRVDCLVVNPWLIVIELLFLRLVIAPHFSLTSIHMSLMV